MTGWGAEKGIKREKRTRLSKPEMRGLGSLSIAFPTVKRREEILASLKTLKGFMILSLHLPATH